MTGNRNLESILWRNENSPAGKHAREYTIKFRQLFERSLTAPNWSIVGCDFIIPLNGPIVIEVTQGGLFFRLVPLDVEKSILTQRERKVVSLPEIKRRKA